MPSPSSPHTRPASPRPRGPRLPERALWVNGEIVSGESAAISLFDRGARDGDGLRETIRIERGQPLHWERHMERLVVAAAELGFPVPPSPSRLRHALAQLLAHEGLSDALLRLTVTRGVPGGRPTRTGAWMEVEPLAVVLWSSPRRGGASAIFSRRPFHPGPLGPYKTTSRLAYNLAREEARAARADEALLVTAAGEVIEGATTNLFAVRGGEVLTPPLACGCLPGVTRALVLECCRGLGLAARETPLTCEDLLAADEAFLTNSIQQVVPLATLERRAYPGRAVGERLLAAYRALPPEA